MNAQGGQIATSDRLQFAQELFDRHAEEVYHYVLAWTGDQASAVDLTATVLRTAVARMDRLSAGADAAELELRLIALVRAAVTRWRASRSGGPPVATAVPEESMALFDGLGALDDDQREVLTLCELLGQEPEHAARVLGCDTAALRERRDDALESLWRAVHGAPSAQAVATWDRLTVGTALRRAATVWLSPPESVLAYLGEQLFGEAPVGVPATAPGRGGATRKAARKPRREASAGPTPVMVSASAPGSAAGKVAAVAVAKLAPPKPANAPAAAAAPAGGPGGGAAVSPAAAAKAAAKLGPAAAATQAVEAKGPRGKVAVADRELDDRPGPHRAVAALLLLFRGRWAAWGVAAAVAATVGVVVALTIGGPVSGSSQCATRLACPPSTTVEPASGNAGEVVPAPTDASGNALPTTTKGPGVLGPEPGFPLIVGRGTTSTSSGQATTTTGRTATTANPPKTTRSTTPPTTAPPTTAPPTTAPPTTAPPTTAPPTTAPPL
jgi:DNA-directed RNA polymerase specialized sigma24 family protein